MAYKIVSDSGQLIEDVVRNSEYLIIMIIIIMIMIIIIMGLWPTRLCPTQGSY